MTGDQFNPDNAADLDTLFALPHGQDEAKVWLVPVPFEATTSFGKGTAHAPQRILEASWQVDLFDLETGTPWKAGLSLLQTDPEIITLNQRACELVKAYENIRDETLLGEINVIGDVIEKKVFTQTQAAFDAQKIPGIIGGDHSVPLGAVKCASETFDHLGVLHIDAHADLRRAYQGYAHSHASIFYNVMTQCKIEQLVQVGVRDLGEAEYQMAQTDNRIHLHTDIDIQNSLAQGKNFSEICHRILQPLPQNIWISFDIDGLDPSLCPHTGTPVPGGLKFREALTLLAALGQSGRRIVGFDLVEVGNNPYDANVAARLLYKMAGWALKSQQHI